MDELVKEVAEMSNCQPKITGDKVGGERGDEEWLPPELKPESAPETVTEAIEAKEGSEDTDKNVPPSATKNFRRRRKLETKISKLSKSTFPISCPRCAQVLPNDFPLLNVFS